MAATSDDQTLRILCFGDSLTVGYSSMGTIYRPYSEKMVQMIQMAFPHHEIQTQVDGLSGDTIWHGFLPRIKRQFPEPNKYPYDWTIILGGTNDLAYNFPIEEIFQKLVAAYDVALSRGSKVLALTVPEAAIHSTARQRIDKKRNRLNDLIKGYKRDNFHVFDLNAAVTYFDMTPTDREKYWDDHVHFTPKGYDLIGNKVGMALVSILVKQRVADLPPAKRKRVFRNDDVVFDEETGDPTAIDQGYVVVRRIDLD
ncbi:SGNH hydrolase-type esterase domain-containing protein [Podospora fimiseda]|uniref:SGNH hydrolase-type esterase domain-containing protein n=1 Tax=Podospora fimiseda TaxID=252190 RepID=A0AAN7H600_9PEZI|nr:SGNH hydrolase-type esterase domain-containing protein [Podospora fimiseda]